MGLLYHMVTAFLVLFFFKLHTGEGDVQKVKKEGDICIHMADSC